MEFDESIFEMDRIRRQTVSRLKQSSKTAAETAVFKILLEGVECLLVTPQKPFLLI
jgi:hypothetical protein